MSTRRNRRFYLFDLANGVGAVAGRLGVVLPGLEERRLLDAAIRAADLDDFGDDWFLEPMRLLLCSLETEARLNLVGRIATRSYLLELLTNRLRLVADRRSYPQIGEQEIRRPLFITGLPRTGSTLLHGLFAQDTAIRVPLTWEVMYPSPPPTREDFDSDPRIIRADKRLSWVDRLAPEFKIIHPVGARLTQECIAITTHAFASIQFHTTYNVPSYQSWLDDADLRPAYRCHREFLQQLQWRCPGERWVLKAPAHMFGMPELFSIYPDACIVQTHRDPLVVAASIASHGIVLRDSFSDHVDPAAVAADWTRLWSEGLDRIIKARDDGVVPNDRILDIHYRDIVADPIGTVRSIYTGFDMSLSADAEARMRRFLAHNPKDKHGRHRYSLEQFGLDPEEEEKRFTGYRSRFDVPAE